MVEAQTRTSIILYSLSDHLDMLAGQILSMEETVGDALRGETNDFAASVSKLQSLDYVRQSLEDCAVLALIIAKNQENGVAPQANQLREKLKLESTKELVSPAAGSTQKLGEVQLF